MGVTKNPLNLKALEKLKAHMRFVESTDIYKNAVASSSSSRVEDIPVVPPTIEEHIPTPQP